MPSIGHLAVGLAAQRVAAPQGRLRRFAWLSVLVGVSFLPDLDVLAFRMGIPYGAPFGHRGAAHSLVVGALLGLLAGLAGWRLGLRLGVAIVVATAVAVSHGLLDTLTDGGRGIALFWPLSAERVFAGWRPIPVAPIGSAILSPRGMAVMLKEAALFMPLIVVALWPRRRRGRGEEAR